MMDLLGNLALGMGAAGAPVNLLYCFIGVTLGTLVGVLPGLGPLATISMLLPITYALPPLAALIMLAGIYYGAQYGGSTTAILINLPGETSSVVTSLDGHQMARQGKGGQALAVAALASFFAGTVSTLVIAVLAAPLAELAFTFGPADYFSLMLLGLIGAVVMASGSLLKAGAMVVLGLFLGLIGNDTTSGIPRFTLGVPDLRDGIDFVIISMGIFGIAEVIINFEQKEHRGLVAKAIKQFALSRSEWLRAAPAAVRGTLMGSILGVLPGGGTTLSSFGAYAMEKKISRHQKEFGKGAIEGVAAPEAANNAAAQVSFIPLLTLGIPSNPIMALMLGAMVIQKLQPGPMVMQNSPELFWGLIASMWIGNLMLVILNLPLVSLWVKVAQITYKILAPAILIFCCLGVFSLRSSGFDIVLAMFFGVVGYVMIKLKCEPAPLLLGFILGPLMEEYLRRALLISRGNWWTFLEHPVSATFIVIAIVLAAIVIFPAVRSTRDRALQES